MNVKKRLAAVVAGMAVLGGAAIIPATSAPALDVSCDHLRFVVIDLQFELRALEHLRQTRSVQLAEQAVEVRLASLQSLAIAIGCSTLPP